MPRNKRSFFERLTGTINVDEDDFDDYADEYDEEPEQRSPRSEYRPIEEHRPTAAPEEGQLSIDMYQTADLIVIQAMVAGVRPEDLDVSISREMVTVRGRREGPHGIEDRDYYHHELYWGTFSRSVVLPQEVDVEEAEATENHGLLIIRLPKIDKARETKLQVKSHL
jgi:HSP20 family protein